MELGWREGEGLEESWQEAVIDIYDQNTVQMS